MGRQGIPGRVSAVCAAVFALLLACAGHAAAAPGDLDPTFNGNGKRVIDYGPVDGAYGAAVQANGRIVLSGRGSGGHFSVTRLNPDGSFDSGFSGDGTASVVFPGYDYSLASQVVVQPDGKIMLGGSASTGTYGYDIALARLNGDGSPDAGFGSGGAGQRAFGASGVDNFGALGLLPDGKMMISWSTGPTTSQDALLGRLHPDGFGDTSYGFAGQRLIPFAGDVDYPEGLAVLADGRTFVALSLIGNGSSQIAAARFLPDASPDGSFDGDGLRVVAPGTAADVVVQPDGKILIGGTDADNFVVWRLNPDGSPDASFGVQGRRTIDFDGRDSGRSLALQANGKILIAGGTDSGNDFAVARLQPGGEFDTTFSFDGKQKVDFGGGDSANAVALQPDGGIIVAGSTASDVAVSRLEGDRTGGGPSGGGSGGSGSGGKPPRCAGKRATIVGTNKRDKLRGTKKADVIAALGGRDSIKGLGGNDRICGGSGNDRIDAGNGNDRVEGGSGKDNVKGGKGKDRMKGGPGNDLLDGGAGADRLEGQGGRDRLLGRGGRDKLKGGPGKDRQRQ